MSAPDMHEAVNKRLRTDKAGTEVTYCRAPAARLPLELQRHARDLGQPCRPDRQTHLQPVTLSWFNDTTLGSVLADHLFQSRY